MGSLRPDTERIGLLEEALAALGGRRDALIARVTARLARARSPRTGGPPPRLADEAVALARELGDDEALANTLYVWCIVHATSANFETAPRTGGGAAGTRPGLGGGGGRGVGAALPRQPHGGGR